MAASNEIEPKLDLTQMPRIDKPLDNNAAHTSGVAGGFLEFWRATDRRPLWSHHDSSPEKKGGRRGRP